MRKSIYGTGEVLSRGNFGRAARQNAKCLRCDKPLTGRQEKWCSDSCRYRRKNEVRLTAEKTIFILAENILRLKPDGLVRFCLNELHARGYEVTKK